MKATVHEEGRSADTDIRQTLRETDRELRRENARAKIQHEVVKAKQRVEQGKEQPIRVRLFGPVPPISDAEANWPENSRKIWEARYCWPLYEAEGIAVYADHPTVQTYYAAHHAMPPVLRQETPEEALWRVACTLGYVELDEGWSSPEDAEEFATRLFYSMLRGDFLPNSPTLSNAGRTNFIQAACTAYKVPDSIGQGRYGGMFGLLRIAALVQQAGAGTGFNWSDVRPQGDIVGTTGGMASGPLSFITSFDAMTESIRQGSIRRGANMATLSATHRDLRAFITSKRPDPVTKRGLLQNFNISVIASDAFMQAVEDDAEWTYMNPKTKQPDGTDKARAIMDLICEEAWAHGDPGLQFIDRIEHDNPVPHVGPLDCVNPCGEQDLMDGEACNLGSINLANMIRGIGPTAEIDRERLDETTELAVRALDDVISAGNYLVDEMREIVYGNRKVGLGVMGLGSALAKRYLAYDQDGGREMAAELMRQIEAAAVGMSRDLAIARGPFPYWKGSLYETRGELPRRNATVTTIAPTGTISILARVEMPDGTYRSGMTGGVEPYFAVVYTRVGAGSVLVMSDPVFAWVAEAEGFASDDVMQAISQAGTVVGVDGVPLEFQRIFADAHHIRPMDHVRMVAAMQPYVENAISKTINLRHEATPDDVRAVYMEAWRLGCKGVTVFRDGCRDDSTGQVLNTGVKSGAADKQGGLVVNHDASVAPPAPQGVIMRERPPIVNAKSVRIEAPEGTLFVTLTEDEHGPLEVFAQGGKAGSDVAANLEAVCRLASQSLRAGIPVSAVIDQLAGIGGRQSVGFGKNRVRSTPDAIAHAMAMVWTPAPTSREEDNRDAIPMAHDTEEPRRHGDMCPQCGMASVQRTEGCERCLTPGCSYSLC